MMLKKLRNPLPIIENAGEMAVDRVKKAANSAGQAAKDATSQLEDWAKDGYGAARDAVKTKPFMWGAASLGFGALLCGLYALWQRGAAEGKKLPGARTCQTILAETKGTPSVAKRKSKRTGRARGPRVLEQHGCETSRWRGANREAASQNLASL
jgi:hypothetical protein